MRAQPDEPAGTVEVVAVESAYATPKKEGKKKAKPKAFKKVEQSHDEKPECKPVKEKKGRSIMQLRSKRFTPRNVELDKEMPASHETETEMDGSIPDTTTLAQRPDVKEDEAWPGNVYAELTIKPPDPQPVEDPDYEETDRPSCRNILRCDVFTVPDVLYWPNIEVLVVIFFAAGIVHSCASVLSNATSAGRGLATAGLVMMAIFLLHETTRVLLFTVPHRKTHWFPTKKQVTLDEMDDMFMRRLARWRLVTPARRMRGTFRVFYEDLIEPERTKRAIRAPLALWWRRYPGDMYASLSCSWLARSSGSVRFPFMLSRVLMQVGFSAIAGAGAPLLFTCVALILLQATLGIVCFVQAQDRLEGIISALEANLSGLSLFLLLLSDVQDSDGWMAVALITLMASLLSPILYLVYDLVMVVRTMRKSEGGIKGAMGRSGSFRLPHSPSSRSSMRREGQATAPATAPASASASVLDAEPGLMHRDATDNEQRAATKITSVAKGKASRKKSESERGERERVRNELRRQRQEAKAASTINAAARGKISRRDSMSKQSERKAARDRSREERARSKAATRISSVHRGRQTRRDLEKRQREIDKEHEAATKMANAVRDFVGRVNERKAMRQAVSATVVSALVRGFMARLQIRRMQAQALQREEFEARKNERKRELEKERMARKEEQLAATQRRQEKRNAQIKAANTINALARGWKQRRKLKLQKLAEEEAKALNAARDLGSPVADEAPMADASVIQTGEHDSSFEATPAAALTSAAGVQEATPASANAHVPASAPAAAVARACTPKDATTSHPSMAPSLDDGAGALPPHERDKAAAAAEARALAASKRGQVGSVSKMGKVLKTDAEGGARQVEFSDPRTWD